MARLEFTAGYGSRRRGALGPRIALHSFAQPLSIEPLEERRFLSASSVDVLPELLLANSNSPLDAPIIAENAPRFAGAGTGSDLGPVAEPAVIDSSGSANTSAAQLLAYGGPGNPTLPGFSNVGKGSTGNSSVTYLGNGWVITAAHVTIDNQYGPIRFGSQAYQADMSSIRTLSNPNGTSADLKIFRLTTDPGLPSVLNGYLSTKAPSWNDQVFMIGNGYTPGTEKFWRVSMSTTPWTWTEQSAPTNPGQNDEAGWTNTTSRTIRWGDNRVQSSMFIGVGGGNYIQAFTTIFDSSKYTTGRAQPYEAQAVSGDSGGAVFQYQNGRWVLGGIMISVTPSLSGQPANTSLYGSLTFMADLSYYRDQILAITQPSTVVGRHLFYNDSKFDGQTAGASASDDLAIAPDKVAYLPGTGAATFDNISSFTRGINGIMIDVAGSHGSITTDDFSFKIGNSNSPDTWASAPAPALVTVRAGAGVNGSDRVEIIWDSPQTPQDTWLQVIVRGHDALGNYNTVTGLATSDVFYFGSKVGDTGSGTPVVAITNLTDETAVRNNVGFGVTLLNVYDFDRNGVVQLSDANAVRNNTGFIAKINLAATPAAPTVDSLVTEAPDPSVLAAQKPSALTPSLQQPAATAQAAVLNAGYVRMVENLLRALRERFSLKI